MSPPGARRPVTVGIVGTHWGRTHVGTVRACGHEVAVIVGRDPGKTRRVAAEEGVALGTTDLRALEDVDVVVIASSTSSHRELVERFLHKPIICEKPLLDTAAPDVFARRIEAPEVRLYVCYAFGHLRTAEHLAHCVREGELGSVERIDMRLGVSLDPPLSRDHWLLDVGSHPVAWLSGLFGPFARCGTGPGAGDHAIHHLRSATRSLDVVIGAAREAGIEYELTLHGSLGRATIEGTYRVGSAWSFSAAVNDRPLAPPETATDSDPWYEANCRHVAAVLAAFDGGPRDGLLDGAAALRVEAPLRAP